MSLFDAFKHPSNRVSSHEDEVPGNPHAIGQSTLRCLRPIISFIKITAQLGMISAYS